MVVLPPGMIIKKARLALLRGRTWRYLRYIHLRDAVSAVDDEVRSICVAGTGHGYAELALAAEFPHITFTLTDVVNRAHGYPNYHATMDMAWKWGVDNIRFSVWNVLDPTERRFDLVASTEMLEHIKDARRAVDNMRKAANRYVYCLVPFADEQSNARPDLQKRAWERHEHFVVGYDEATLCNLLPSPVFVRGAYWEDAGQPFRKMLTDMDDDTITAQQQHLERQANSDLLDQVPSMLPQALGIKVLSRS